ncbi:LacI family transcriptional regulator [Streptomyces sp. HNM0575]|uniref:substrate-binding domain-containing protein n=1 Tax=Streptomyces sp. HNM0575 TaxID=2716338 RepID=UPI00145C54F0|nr:LacI family transcriptional regulator [Streptomyces sp. HNM0575]
MTGEQKKRTRASRAQASGHKTVSIRDVAEAAGVSVATVSRALSADSESFQMRAETRRHVLETSAALGYRPNDLARALLQQRTSVLGVIVPDISNPYYPGMVRGIEDVASLAGYRIVLCNTDREPERLNRYLETLVKSRVDGVLIAGGAADTAIDVGILDQYNTKVVVVGRHGMHCPSVQVDNVAAGEAITAHLIALGHRRIAFAGGPESSRTMQDRVEGYRRALTAHRLAYDESLVRAGEFDEDSGYGAARALTRLPDPPTAVVSVNDRVAVGVLAALHDEGVPVPGRMSVTGFDDVSFSSFLRPKLTTVAVPTYEIGSTAARLLVDRIPAGRSEGASEEDEGAGESRDGATMLPTKVVVRDSSGPPA